MTIRETIIAAVTGISLLASTAHAGGPVIVEDAAETAPVVRDNALPFILLGLAVAAVVLGGGGSNCVQPEPEPTPEPC